MALPIEIYEEGIRIAMFDSGGDSKIPMNIMLTCRMFLAISRRLYHRSITLHDHRATFRFFRALCQCEASTSQLGPRAALIFHLRFAHLPAGLGFHGDDYRVAALMMPRMTSLRTITTDFRDDCTEFDVVAFGRLFSKPLPKLQTVRFVSANICTTEVSPALPTTGRH